MYISTYIHAIMYLENRGDRELSAFVRIMKTIFPGAE